MALQAIGLGMAVVVRQAVRAHARPTPAQVIAAAETAGVALSVYQNRRWDSDLLTLQQLLAQGRLGEVQRFESAFERFEPPSGPPAAGGGILRDFGSHLVDQALLLFGPADVRLRRDAPDTADVATGFFALPAPSAAARGATSAATGGRAPRRRACG